MKVVKFKGGLGNQLFQYSFQRALQLKYNYTDVKADFSYYNYVKDDKIRVPRIEKLNIKINKANSKELDSTLLLKHIGNPTGFIYKSFLFFEKTLNSKYYFESDRSYRDSKKLNKFDYFDGYWQSWRYLEGIECDLKKEIVLKNKFSKKTEEVIKNIKNENAIFLGIRRGDYIESSKSLKHFGIFDSEYYSKAIEFIKERVKNPVFYIFSNDIEWVKENMKFDCNINYRDDAEQTSDVEELFIMASCKHAIIVNSTFYWWGAWLIDNPEKIVIAPNKWFADNKPIDIIPDSWIKM